ncbi:MAG: glycogen/starch synthase [Bacteroidales bacterium]|nr:glycogen/starch synthase [Bacteroidales bacterium]
MESTKVLFITQEITPYLPESRMSLIGRTLPQGIQEKGKEIRTFMPKYGCINERRNQLHEVIRLSGMNLIINDTDHPLIIKVASIQSARMQVYFIDNEDYFYRKSVLTDENGSQFEDNDERCVFFARGVLETVRKLRWAPDIIHCHGWFTSLVPLFIKTSYLDDPLFMNSKVIYSIYNDEFKGELNASLKDKVLMEGISQKKLSPLNKPNYINLNKLAVEMADGIIIGSEEINQQIKDYIENSDKPLLYHQDDEFIDMYSEFYDKLLLETIDEPA